ncbi:MAG: DUF4340 domain-containing protein [Moorea sp. SIO1F2]|nr:DUF4340 domain-containing protein [Moorena sp. SIO4A5]NEP25485.1 DUF4340 domain-containing protein [Moorena sp. SIO3I6]NEQ59450.1 DUF4340 domain-containing protein [Moorena sp. SIO4A1]NET82342.1 DUF4340 domain-containing protein [Moorena sp. SIO1F2]
MQFTPMKLQRTTLILVISAILLGGGVYIYEIQGSQKREAAKTPKKPIFNFTQDEIQSFTVNSDDKTLVFERASEPESGWRMKKPKEATASDAVVSFLLNLLAQGKSDRILTVSPDQLPEYGLDKPSATITVKLKNQDSPRLILGNLDFTRSFLYAQVLPLDSKSEQSEVLLVPVDFQYAVSRPLSEWLVNQDKAEEDKPSAAEKTD